MTDLKPLSAYYLVRLVAPAEESAGGILLPETARVNFTEAEVLAAGPGRDFGPHRAEMQAAVGERVLFQAHDFHALDQECGFVKDEDLVGVHGADGTVWPLNDFVRLTQDRTETESRGGIALADTAQRRVKRGRIEEYGLGRLIRRGAQKGLRRSALSGYWKGAWTGAVGYWDDRARALDVASDEQQCVLVRAEDLIAVYVKEEEGDGVEEGRPRPPEIRRAGDDS